jgi:hypothetical protein
MEIILLILKIIGFVLLGVLGLALLLVLAVLFVPVRYKAKGSKHEDLKADGRITWLLHILRIRIIYDDGKLKTNGKLLFFKIIDSDEDVEKELADDDDSLFPDDIDDADFSALSGVYEEADELGNNDNCDKTDDTVKKDNVGKKDDTVKKDNVDKTDDTVKDDVCDKTGGIVKDGTVEKKTDALNDDSSDKKTNAHTTESDKVTVTDPSAKNSETMGGGSSETDRDSSAEEEKEKLSGHKVGKKMKRKKDDIETGEEEPKKQGIVKKVKNLYNIKNDPEARRFYHVVKKRLVKIVRHILPRKLKGSVRFGTGDPCSTGKILGAAAMLYPIYGGHINVEPVFEEKALEFDLYLRGRIRIVTVLIPAL